MTDFFLSQDSSVLYRASHLADVDYLLIHGTGDGRSLNMDFYSSPPLILNLLFPSLSADNVHFQNTAQLVEALTEANVLFDMQVKSDLLLYTLQKLEIIAVW